MIDNIEKTETKKFDTEVGKILHLMIHSLYTNKEIFLRELISNSSDACDKLRYLSQTDNNLLGNDPNLRITISIDKENRLLKVRDNGIGMNREDLINNIGTIARSGTQGFLEQLSGDNKKDSMLIGQFGVGFYSSYMVADEVTIKSKKASEKDSYIWTSKGDGEYTIAKNNEDFERGTEITLHIKENEDDFLDHFRLKHIVKTYSDHISIPILFIDSTTGNETQVNSSSALWTRQKSEITAEQYNEFYKKVGFAGDDPWLILHNKNEGIVEYTNLLFIPTNKTFDLYHPDRKRRVKLYIKRVFITDEGADLVPHYMRFLRGVIDSEDLPLNISRETLQHNNIIERIKTSVTKRVLSELKSKLENSRDEYLNFWNNFGPVLKEGLCEPLLDYEKIMEICLFKSALTGKLITFDEYISNMKPDQNAIYYLSGDDPEKLIDSPQIEGFISKGIDVLLFSDSVDDFWANVVTQYKEKDIKSVTRADISSENHTSSSEENKSSDTKEVIPEENQQLIDYFKNTLGSLVSDVKISKKLTTSPVCLVVDAGGMDIRMEKFLLEQKQLPMSAAKILEINANHKIVQKISSDVQSGKVSDQTSDLTFLLFDEACINESIALKDPIAFAKRLNKFIESNI